MIGKVFDATARHRRAILVGGAVVAVVEAALFARRPLDIGSVIVVAAVAVLLVLLSRPSFDRARPAAFMVRADVPAFVVRGAAGPVFLALAYLFLAAFRAGGLAAFGATSARPYEPSLVVTIALMAAFQYTQAWIGTSISLRPDGLYDRRGLGTVFVPWDATPTAQLPRSTGLPTSAAAPDEIRLAHARPELVRMSGLARNATFINTEHVDAEFLAAAINYYAEHPAARAQIGTTDEYQRLRQALTRSGE